MKYQGSVIIVILALLTVCTVSMYPYGFSQQQKNTVNLQTYLVSDFGNEVDQASNIVWNARFSRFAKPQDASVILSPWDTNACAVAYLEAKPIALPAEAAARMKWCLGIKAEFTKKGYNYIEIYPKVLSNANTSSNIKPNPYAPGTETALNLKGVVKSLDMWVWGGNYKYSMEFYLEDFKGFLHRLPAGLIDYVGWEDFRTEVPAVIPQAENHVPFLKPLKITMIKLWADPEERVDQFYCYFDYFQVQTDEYLERFDGDDLANDVW